jgi:hypothetical protein
MSDNELKKRMKDILVNLDPEQSNQPSENDIIRLLEHINEIGQNIPELLEMTDDDGNTLIHYAIRYKYIRVIDKLIQDGNINLTKRNDLQETPLILAKIFNMWFPHPTRKEIVEILEKRLMPKKGGNHHLNKKSQKRSKKLHRKTHRGLR